MPRVAVLTIAAAVLWAGPPHRLASQTTCDEPPLALEDVEYLVQNFVPFTRLRQRIEGCGVTFIADAAAEKRLRAAGGNDDVIRLVAPPRNAKAGESWRPATDRREMIWIPSGSVQLGSPTSEASRDADESQHSLSIQGFWMDQTEVTNEAYRRFVIANARWQKDRVDQSLVDARYLNTWNGNDFPPAAAREPVVNVSWHAATAYALWAGKRLPTEAEWEYAARAGAAGPYWWDGMFDATRANNGSRPATVATSATRNPWGLFDVLGNAAEWVSSVYAPYPYARDDGRERRDAMTARVVRGGSWNQGPQFLRVGNRNNLLPNSTSDRVGFRCAF